MLKNAALICLGLLILSGCASDNVNPDPDKVTVSRQEPEKDKKCQKVGMISGTTLTEAGTRDEAILDLKKEAANRGANYVKVEQFSAYGTTVTGQAYICR